MCTNNAADPQKTISEHQAGNRAEMSEEEVLGKLVAEILSAGKTLSRKTLCFELLKQLDVCEDATTKQHYANIFRKLLAC